MPLFGKRNRAADAAVSDTVDSRDVETQRPKRKLGNIGTIFAAGSAMFCDGYSNAAISPVKTILAKLYPDTLDKKKNHNAELIASMAFMGMVIGMILFGYVSDKIGRKIGMYICTTIIFVFSILSATSGAGASPQVQVNCLIAFRTILGVGIGGEYPSGSVTAAEATENTGVKKKSQQRLFVWATNTMLDFAFPIAWFVAWVLLQIFGEHHLRAVWRGTLLLGAIPPLILLVARLWMVEPEVYRKNNMRKAPIPYWLLIKRYWLRLLGLSIVWFIYDWIVYPFGMYADTITSLAAPNATLSQSFGWACLINAFYVPGTIVGSLIVDYLGPKYTLIFGFTMQAIFGFALSGAYNHLVKHVAGFAVMYGIFLGFGEVGPGNNLGLLASKAISPTCARGQLYGVAAAIGKVGAFIGSYTFPQIIDSMAKRSKYLENTGIFWVGSALAIFAALVAFLTIPNIGPDWMVEEEIKFREYLRSHGYDTAQIGDDDSIDEFNSPEKKDEGRVAEHPVHDDFRQ